MSKFTDFISGVAVAAVVASGSSVEKACDVVPPPVCEGAQIVTSVADAVKDINEGRESNDSIGNR